MLGDEIDNVSDDLTTNARRISEQYDPDARLSVRESQLPEVLVFGQQDASITHGEVNDFGVGCLCVRLGHCYDIVSGVAALVGQEAHCYPDR